MNKLIISTAFALTFFNAISNAAEIKKLSCCSGDNSNVDDLNPCPFNNGACVLEEMTSYDSVTDKNYNWIRRYCSPKW